MEYNFDKDAVVLQGPEEIRTILGVLGVSYVNNVTYEATAEELITVDEALAAHNKLDAATHNLKTPDELCARYLRLEEDLASCAIFQRRECLLS